MTGIELALTVAIGWVVSKVLGGGDAKKNGTNGTANGEKKNYGAKKIPSGNPPAWPPTFNHVDWPSVRLQFTLLGYANNQYSVTKPSGSFVKQFQRDYNTVSGATLNGLISANNMRLGRLIVDGLVGAHTTNALEGAKQLQGISAKTWQQLVTHAREGGY